ncbi:MAG: class I SAM-dependent RNA methyltransferase [Desulfovibrionaceae bacterium]|nr:class I SAM-dependent RNA methyltransferase [Desulfovibrionaceae bacterium]
MQEYLATITGLADDGRGVARLDGRVCFVSGALPGQTVAVRIVRDRKRFAEAACLRVIGDMPDAVAPLCPHEAECGGCPLQRMPYARQLEWKTRLVRDAFGRIGGLREAPVREALASPRLDGFRNKMEFAFGAGEDGKLVLGLRRRASRGIVDVTSCALLPEPGMDMLEAVRQLARASGLPPYAWPEGGRGSRAGSPAPGGVWRFAVLRQGRDAAGRPGWWLLLITSRVDTAARRTVRRLGEVLLERFPGMLLGVVHDIRDADDALAQGDRRVLELGPCGAVMRQDLDGLPLVLDAASFFQVNTEAASLLCREVVAAAALESGSAPPRWRDASGPVLWDLYCGSGAPGLALAGRCSRVLGVEYDAAAVRRATDNARALGFAHCRYEAGDAEAVLKRLAGRGALPAPDVVLIDPPRAGMGAGVTAYVIGARPRRIVYVSCNPATLARDAGRLCAAGWRLRRVQPVDLFPHTPHVECVALLELDG